MKAKIINVLLMIGLSMNVLGQNPTITLRFTAVNDGQHIPLDSILIENLSQGVDTTLYAPDTTLVLDVVSGIGENGSSNDRHLSVAQNYPNPFIENTVFELYVPVNERITISCRDMTGKTLLQDESMLTQGNHYFTLYAGNESVYLISVSDKQISQTIKLVHTGSTGHGKKCILVYCGKTGDFIGFKSRKANDHFGFSPGDELKYSAYTDVEEKAIIDAPAASQLYTIQFDGWIACPGQATVSDVDGNTYNTVQIGGQCWMKENLKTTTYRNGTSIPEVTDETAWSGLTSGAYAWYENDSSWKDKYGVLYNWFAVVDANGLCPDGWHAPTNDEWTALTDHIGGTNPPYGNMLKSCRQANSPLEGACNTQTHPRWNEHGMQYGTDDYRFSMLPGGYRDANGFFGSPGYYGNWWTSTEDSPVTALSLSLTYDAGFIDNYSVYKRRGYSVRCLRD